MVILQKKTSVRFTLKTRKNYLPKGQEKIRIFNTNKTLLSPAVFFSNKFSVLKIIRYI